MHFLYSTRQIKRTLWQIPAIMALSIMIGLVSNAVRKQHLPLIGDWSTEGRLTTDNGEGLAIPFPEAVNAFNQKKTVFIDARAEDLFKQGHIKGARNIPWHKVEDGFMPLTKALKPSNNIITYCDGETCDLSHELASFLINMGFSNTKVLVNGFTLWKNNNLPIEKGK